MESPKDLINRMMMGVFELVDEECCIAMVVDDMDISRIMVLAKLMKDSNIRKEQKIIRMDKESSNGHGRTKNR